jgi:hypothetical protein
MTPTELGQIAKAAYYQSIKVGQWSTTTSEDQWALCAAAVAETIEKDRGECVWRQIDEGLFINPCEPNVVTEIVTKHCPECGKKVRVE